MKKRKCQEVYKLDSMRGEWLNDNLEHHEIFDATDDLEMIIKRCAFCGGKIYPKEYA